MDCDTWFVSAGFIFESVFSCDSVILYVLGIYNLLNFGEWGYWMVLAAYRSQRYRYPPPFFLRWELPIIFRHQLGKSAKPVTNTSSYVYVIWWRRFHLFIAGQVVRGTTAGELSSGTWCRCWTPRPRLTRRCPSSSARWTIILPASTASGTSPLPASWNIWQISNCQNVPDPTGPEWSCSEQSEFTTLESSSANLRPLVYIPSTSVADPNHFNPNSDPDPTFLFDADPDPVCHFDAIRIQLITLMRIGIGILLVTSMRNWILPFNLLRIRIRNSALNGTILTLYSSWILTLVNKNKNIYFPSPMIQ